MFHDTPLLVGTAGFISLLYDRSDPASPPPASHPTRVKSFVDRLLWDKEEHPEDIYRLKGLLHLAESDKKHVLQVGGRETLKCVIASVPDPPVRYCLCP